MIIVYQRIKGLSVGLVCPAVDRDGICRVGGWVGREGVWVDEEVANLASVGFWSLSTGSVDGVGGSEVHANRLVR